MTKSLDGFLSKLTMNSASDSFCWEQQCMINNINRIPITCKPINKKSLLILTEKKEGNYESA
jgi:hypothetical protein